MTTMTLTATLEKWAPRIRRLGVAGIALFTLKGLLWLAVPVMVRYWMG